MAYQQARLDRYRADALAGRPFVCATCPYCNGTRDATVKHLHPSTKPADPWAFWHHVILDKYRAAQSEGAKRNAALRVGAGGEKAFVVGPMVDQSELPFRMLCRQFGATLAYTPMLHAKSFAEGVAYRRHFFTTTPLDVVRDVMGATAGADAVDPTTSSRADAGEDTQRLLDRPCIVQFCGHDPDTVLQAARYAVRGEYTDPHDPTAVRSSPSDGTASGRSEAFYYYCDAVDLNLGCPQGIARRGHYGSFLMEDWDLVHTILHTLHVELEVPVTAKIRVFDKEPDGDADDGVSFAGKQYDEVLSVYYAQMIRDAGAQLLCIHGRTREMKGQQSGLANLPLIAKMRAALATATASGKASIPVISNGNVLVFDDVLRAMVITGCEGHMCAEPLLWDPALFSNPAHPVCSGRLPHGADKASRMAAVHTALQYVRWLRIYPVDLGFVKAHLFKMCFHSYELHIGFRDELGKLRTSARALAAAGETPEDTRTGDGRAVDGEKGARDDQHQSQHPTRTQERSCPDGCVDAEEVVVSGDAGETGSTELNALEAHLRALLAAEEACDVVGEQPKAAQAEKKAAKAQQVDVFEDEGGLCIDF